MGAHKGIKLPGKSILPNSSVKSCTATSTSAASVATSVSDDRRRGNFVPRYGDYKKLEVVLIDTEKHEQSEITSSDRQPGFDEPDYGLWLLFTAAKIVSD